jgi:hypothetical protein
VNILLTGATGFIGQHLVPILQRNNHSITLVTRNIAAAKKKLVSLKEGLNHFEKIQFVVWNSENEAFPEECLQNINSVVHLMGENIAEGRWTSERKNQLVRSRVESSRKIIDALNTSNCKVTKFVSASAVGIYPNFTSDASSSKGAIPQTAYAESYFPSEESAKSSFLVQLVRDWEMVSRSFAFKDRHSIEGRTAVQLRIGIVLGNEGFLKKIVPLYRMGLGGPIGQGDQILPWVHVEDVARAIVWALEKSSLSGPVNLVGPKPSSYLEMSEMIAKICKRPHFLRVPPFFLKVAMGEQSEIALSSLPVYPNVLLENGFQFQFTDLHSALKDLLEPSASKL